MTFVMPLYNMTLKMPLKVYFFNVLKLNVLFYYDLGI